MWNLGPCPHYLGRLSCVSRNDKSDYAMLTLVNDNFPTFCWRYNVENDCHPLSFFECCMSGFIKLYNSIFLKYLISQNTCFQKYKDGIF